MNVMTVEGYHAKIEYDEELDLFHGEILGLSGGADFYGKNPKELRTEFKKSLQVFLEVCKEKGLDRSAGPGQEHQYPCARSVEERVASRAASRPRATCWPR